MFICGTAYDVVAGGGSWDGETSWNITNADGITVVEGIAGTTSACIDMDAHTNMFDSFGDGWNGGTTLRVNHLVYQLVQQEPLY